MTINEFTTLYPNMSGIIIAINGNIYASEGPLSDITGRCYEYEDGYGYTEEITLGQLTIRELEFWTDGFEPPLDPPVVNAFIRTL